MTEATQEVQTETVTEPQVQEQTLDDLYKESGLEDVSQTQTQAAPEKVVQTQETKEINVPDPYDIEAHKAFIGNLAKNQTALHESLQKAQEIIATKERETLMAKLEEEINQASEFVATESGIENSRLATFELSERARTDAKFKALWEGRNSSSQAKAAFSKALKVVASQIGDKYAVKTDPTLVANKKALAASRQSSSTTTQEDKTDEWSGLSEKDFQARWQRMVSPNN
jgi:hypothetical protein